MANSLNNDIQKPLREALTAGLGDFLLLPRIDRGKQINQVKEVLKISSLEPESLKTSSPRAPKIIIVANNHLALYITLVKPI